MSVQLYGGYLCRFYRKARFYVLAGVVCGFLTLFAAVGEEGEVKSSTSALKASFFVVGVTDFQGALTVSVVDNAQYLQTKKEVELDNKAMSKAYDNLKDAAYDKNIAEYKAELAKLRTSRNNNQRGGNNRQGNQQQQQIKRKVAPFPIPEPKSREFHLYGLFADQAAADNVKKLNEEKEAARLTSIQNAEAAKEKAESSAASALKKPVMKKKEQAAPPKEIADQLAAEFEKVKKEMSEDPAYAATGRKTDKPEEGADKKLKKGKDADKKIGGETDKTLKSTKKIKGAIGS